MIRKSLCMHTHLFYVQYLAVNNTDILATPTGSVRLAIIYRTYAFGRLTFVTHCLPLPTSHVLVNILPVLLVFNVFNVCLSGIFLI